MDLLKIILLKFVSAQPTLSFIKILTLQFVDQIVQQDFTQNLQIKLVLLVAQTVKIALMKILVLYAPILIPTK
jgi:hypothetical protein